MIMKLKTLILTVVMLCVCSLQGMAQTLYGSVLNNGELGVYSLDVQQADKGWTPVVKNAALSAEGAGTYTPEFYCNIRITDTEKILTVNDANLWQTLRQFSVEHACLDMTYNPQTKTVFGLSVVSNESLELAEINPLTGGFTTIGNLSEVLNTLASDASGQLFGISQDGKLYKVSGTDATLTEVGSTGLEPFAQQSMTIDAETGVCYWAFYNDSESALYTVNLATAAVTLVQKFDGHEEVTALTVAPTAKNNAPKTVTDINMTNAGLSFKMPSQTVNNGSLSGSLNYVATLCPIGDDATAALVPETLNGTANVGETVNLSHEIQTGYHLLAVTVSQNNVSSLRASIYKWVGADVPAMASNVSAVKTSEKSVKISWNAVTETAHGGECDLTNVTYDVVRMPGNAVVAEGVTTTEVTDNYDSPTLRKYHYQIYAIAGKSESEPASTEGVVLGPALNTPYAEDFSTTTGFDLLTVKGGVATWYQDVDSERLAFSGDNAQTADEWLILPPVELKKDSVYNLAFDVCCESQQTHKLAVNMGSLPNVDALTTVLMPETEYATDFSWQHVDVRLQGEGVKYLALHLTSEKNSFPFYLDNLKLTSLYATNVPAAPVLTVTPDENGAEKVNVKVVLPTKALDNTNLTGTLKAVVTCDDKNVAELEGQPGATVEKSIDIEKGLHTFKASVNNGEVAQSEVWVGLDIPAAVSDVKITEGEGSVTVSWQAPTEGLHGGKIGKLTYSVKYNGWKEIAGTDALSAVMENESWKTGQSTDFFVISAISDGGEGMAVQTPHYTFGKALDLPYLESFVGGKVTYEKWTSLPLAAETTWAPVSDVSKDEIGGALLLSGIASAANEAYVLGPKWNFTGVAKPKVTFSLTHDAIDDDLDVVVVDSKREEHLLGTISLKNVSDWQDYSYDLSSYAGQDFAQLLLRTHNVLYGDMAYVDSVTLTDATNFNLAASQPVLPASLSVGTEGKLLAPVVNVGQQTVEGGAYTVNLYKNGSLLNTYSGQDVKAGETVQIEMPYTPTVSDLYSVDFQYVINCEIDEAKGNNTSKTATLNVSNPIYPTVKDFAGDEQDGQIVFTWNAPDIEEGTGIGVTESFESFTAFSYDDLQPWQTSHYNYGSREYTMEFRDAAGNWVTYTNSGENMGWQIFNTQQVAAAEGIGLVPLSGSQFVLSPYCSGTTINTLDTPKLSGEAQTLRINAKSLNNQNWGLETFSVLNGETVLATFENVPSQWTTYDVEIPAGVTRVTIQVTPVTALLLDDITYVPEGAETTQYHLTGYNVYCDGQLVANLPSTQQTYTTNNTETGHRWGVTAVYQEGESGYQTLYVTAIQNVENVKNEGDVYWLNPVVKIQNGRKLLVR